MAFATIAMIGAGVAAAGGIAKLGMSLAGRRDRIEEQNAARIQLQERMEEYEDLDTSNIYADVQNKYTNLENTFEDMTVNQQQAQFIAQQGMQQRANIMNQMRGAAGGSGIAALAQAMANQGQLATQQASASIGTQEAKIQQLQAREASRLQQLERAGETQAEAMRLAGAERSRGLEYSKTGTLLGMSQQRMGAANQARAQARAQQLSAVGDIIGAGTQMVTAGMKMNTGKAKADTWKSFYPEEVEYDMSYKPNDYLDDQGNPIMAD
tara:strand:+ start:1650 stop:2450 length:801 start_codon:yes stop_codon:yes gene_type:complete